MPSPPDPPARRPTPPQRPLPPQRALPPRPSAEDEEAARALTNASIQFRRGLVGEAEKAILQILAARPADAGAAELLGDIRLSRDDQAGALEAYQAALQSQPGRPTAEAKLARITLRQAEQARMKKLGVAYASSDAALVRSGEGESKRSAAIAIGGTAVCPGLGQLLSGQYWKGGILAGVFLLGIGLLVLISANTPHVPARASHAASPFSPAYWLVVVVVVVDWVYAVADSALAASRAPNDADPAKSGWKV